MPGRVNVGPTNYTYILYPAEKYYFYYLWYFDYPDCNILTFLAAFRVRRRTNFIQGDPFKVNNKNNNNNRSFGCKRNRERNRERERGRKRKRDKEI